MHNPISDLMFDWITVLHNKAEGVRAYEQYIKDAEAQGAQECVSFFNDLRTADIEQLGKIKSHMGKMFSTDSSGRVQTSHKTTPQHAGSDLQ